MQAAVPDAVDLVRDTEATKRLYGLDQPISAKFGADCLIARRLLERGVRFVQIFTGRQEPTTGTWRMPRMTRPIARWPAVPTNLSPACSKI